MKLSLIVPTRNERGNLPILAEMVHRSLDSQDYELIIVDDDSPDGTGELAEELSNKYPIRVLHRKNERGLASAVIHGIKFTDSDQIIVMDGDLQHPPELLPDLLKRLETHDMVIASRHCEGGGIQGWTLKRKLISLVAILLALPLAPKVKDRTSGYFGFRRDILISPANLNGKGFKIMLEVLVRGRANRVTEVPFTFVNRRYGESKFSLEQIRDYLLQLGALYFYKYRRLVKFCVVGASGTAINFAVLYSLTDFVGLFYLASAIIAVIIASTSNYILNDIWTFKGSRVGSSIVGWLKYNSTSLITDAIYIGLLALFVEIVGLWYMLGAFLSLLIIVPLRFIIVSKWIWGRHRGVL